MLTSIAHGRARGGYRVTTHIATLDGLLRYRWALLHDDVLFLVNSRGRSSLASFHDILDVPGIAVDDDILGLGYPSSESGPICGPAVPGPCARDGVNTFSEGKEGDGKTVDKN